LAGLPWISRKLPETGSTVVFVSSIMRNLA